MGLSTQLEFIRSFLLRFHSLTRRKRQSARHRQHSTSSTFGCVGRLRRIHVLTVRNWREPESHSSDFSSSDSTGRRRRRTKKKKKKFGLGFGHEVFVQPDAIPSEQEEFENFTAIHPGFLDTLVVDELREEEYGELQDDGHVCLDYSGYGLFSQLQQELDADSSSFAISYISGVDLSVQALYGEPDEGTVEYDIRRRIIRFLNIQEGEYSMVFAASKGSAFKILGESYPFTSEKSLLTVFDYESDAVASLQEIAMQGGAQIMNASFNFPSLTVCSSDLKSQLLHSNSCIEKEKNIPSKDAEKKHTWEDRWIRKKSEKSAVSDSVKKGGDDQAKGLFVFPVQSRITGTKYSYQWMSLAQDNGWHVLLDASALGPKDMDCLGLSLCRPDFIVTSFYKVFGSDPTGFGCLFVKNSSMGILRPSPAARNIGMVKLVAANYECEGDQKVQNHYQVQVGLGATKKSIKQETTSHAEVAFSGPISSWRPSHRIKMGGSLEKVDSSPCSPTTRLETEFGTEDPMVLGTAKGAHKCDALHFQTVHTNVSGSRDDVVDDGENKIPLTPRSVLEESLMDGQYQSYELDGRAHSMARSQGNHVRCFEVGETSSKESVISDMDSNPLHFHKPQKYLDKRRLLAYYSHEITSQADPRTTATAFSQPLGLSKRNLSLAHSEGSSYYGGDLEFSSSLYDDDDDDDDDEQSSEFDFEDDASITRRDPEIYCRGLNHADTLGLKRTNDRLRFLINWLISSMLKLQHSVSNKLTPLVHLYGPKMKHDRGASLAFNLFDHTGVMITPALVQQLAEKHNISVGTGVLTHIRSPENCTELQDNYTDTTTAPRLRVVTASLGFFTNFEDVYKLWAFVAKFLDVEFVKKESVCCQTSNQEQVVLDLTNPT